MTSINSVQDQEVTFLSGITANGLLASQSFWTWNGDSPATYSSSANYTAKFGSSAAGTGASISYAFDTASGWTETERAAFSATAALWSAVANVSFHQTSVATADVLISRADDDSASGGQTNLRRGRTGTSNVGVATAGAIDIDTSVEGFGPLGGSFSEYGGHPWGTLIHEWGHVLGLGHGGAYDESLGVDGSAYTSYDNLAWTIMSYNKQSSEYRWGTSRASNGYSYGNEPVTWMPLDILAIQRIYGVAVDTPLSGGQIFGFNSNIGGEIGKFFDFTQNARPIVTLWDKGSGNTLDLSGFSQAANVNLADGSFSSAGGLTNNIAIAYGTRIDSAIGGSGADTIRANDNSDRLFGGAGSDSLVGGSGNDHLYGAAAVAVTGDTADTLSGGSGNDYLQGNAGDDLLKGDADSDRLMGGQGNDNIIGGSGNDTANGNLGNDVIDGGDGNDSLRGGQGNDSIVGGSGNDIVQGDLGADSLAGGAGIDMLTGGGGGDHFIFAAGDASFSSSGEFAGLTDSVADFEDGVDHLVIGYGIPSVVQGNSFADFATAATAAQQALDVYGTSTVIIDKVGADIYVFYDRGSASPLEAIRLEGLGNPALISAADFL